MNKNVKLFCCILGSAVLALSNSTIFSNAKIGMFSSGYGRSIFGILLFKLVDIISLVGFLLLILFSIILIISNIRK